MKTKRTLALFLCLAMVFSFFPAGALAEAEDEPEEIVEEIPAPTTEDTVDTLSEDAPVSDDAEEADAADDDDTVTTDELSILPVSDEATLLEEDNYVAEVCAGSVLSI